jgi:TonB family protein
MRSLSLSTPMLAILGLIATVPFLGQETPSERPAPEVQPRQAAAKRPVRLSRRARIALCRAKGDPPLEPAETPPERTGATRPEIIHHPKPSFSSSDVEGTVIVEAVIDQDGCTRQVKILRGVSKEADAAALEAVRQWVFRPATLDGKPISVFYVMTVNSIH